MAQSSSKKNSTHWKEAFDSLPDDLKNALCFLAIHAAPVRKIRIQECCGCMNLTPERVNGKPCYSRSIVDKHSWNPNKIKKIVDELRQLGWIGITTEGFLHCKSVLRERIVHHLVETGQYQQYADVLFTLIGGRYFVASYSEHRSWDRPKHPEDLVRELRHLLITDGIKPLPEVFRYLEQYDGVGDFYRAIWSLFVPQEANCEQHRNWLRAAKIEFRCLVLQYLLLRAISQLECSFDETWNILIETGKDPKCDPVTQVLILDYALCSGKIGDPDLLSFHGPSALGICGGHQAFVAGEYSKAVELYRIALKSLGNLKAVKNAVLPFLSGVFHALAELHAGNRIAVQENAKYAVAKADHVSRGVDIKFPMRLEGCWNLIDMIAQRLIGKTPNQLSINTTSQTAMRPVWLSLLLSAYESAWFQLKPTPAVEQFMVQILPRTESAFPWIAAETVEVCESLGIAKTAVKPYLKTVSDYRKATKTVPLRDLFTARDEWERWLESLQALASETPKGTKKKTATKKEQPKARLIWRVFYEYGSLAFYPYEQKWLPRSGSWGEEKSITMSRLFKQQNKLDYLTDQDRMICSKIRVINKRGYYNSATEYSFKEEIALEFVGHPLLFGMSEKREKLSTRVELIHARPEISMQEKDGKLHVSFSPPLTVYHNIHQSGAYGQYGNPDDSKSDFFTIKESPTRIKVIRLTKTEMQIRSILGEKGRDFPKKAQGALASLLGKLAGDMSVKTDAKVEFADVPAVPVHAMTYIYLAPNGEGIQADFFVRPLGADSPGHRPGVGSEKILGEVGGKNVQTTRNLKDERKKRDEIIAQFSAFGHGAAQSENQYVFESPADALALLAELKDFASEKKNAVGYEVFWPYGEKFSVTSTASFGNFNLSFSSAEDWLAASGTLKVDNETIELQKLLDLLDDDSESRFVKLSDQKFLALTNEFRKRLGELKRLSHSKGKTVQLHPLAAVGMEEFFDAIPTLQKNSVWNDVKKRIDAARDFKAPAPKSFVGDLRDYQFDGYDWLARSAKWGVGCCLADDMGLGKTIQALALLLLRADQGPSLVVAPTSVCFNWEREAAKFAPTLKIKRIQPIAAGNGFSKAERDKLISSAKKRDVLITSYTLMQQEIDLFAKKKYATVILDEAQAIKNPESNRAKAASMLQADFRIGMTGTPIENRLTELWSLFRFLNPGLFGSQKSFEDRFAVPIQRDGSASARSTLRRLVHPFILRRTKSQVMEELPAKTEIVREIELSREEAALYEAARKNALKELQEIKDKNSGPGRLQILAALTRLRQLCCNPKLVLPNSKVESSKLEAFREIMEELQDNKHKVLVFSQFVKHLEILKAELDEMGISYQYLDGSTPVRERQKRVDAFQSGESDAFLISIKAGGSGLNLTAADYVIHTDPWWNPAVEDQATDRAHRIGQTRPVTVYRLITQGTIEEKIVRLHHEKRDIADKLLEGTDQATKLSAEELIEILRS